MLISFFRCIHVYQYIVTHVTNVTCPSADQADQHFMEWVRMVVGLSSISVKVRQEELVPSQTSLTLRHSRIHPFLPSFH